MENYWSYTNQNKRKTKTCGFCMQSKTLDVNQIKRYTKHNM